MDAANGGGSSGALARALRAAEDVTRVVSVAFGPAGRGVLIQGPTGGLTIARGALDILEAAFPPAGSSTGPEPESGPGPEHVVLLQSARRLRQRTGDGVKGFLLMTAALLRGLQHLQGGVSANVRAELAGVNAALSAALPRGGPRHPPDAALMAASVMATRFTVDVSSAALPAVSSLLRDADATRLRADLEVLCRRRHAAGRAVGESIVKEGVVVDGLLRFLGEGTTRHRLVVLAGDEADDDVDVRAAVRSLLADDAVDADRTLVVTSALLDDASLFALRLRGAAVLHGVSAEDESFVLAWTLEHAVDVEVDVRAVMGGAWLGLAGVKQLQLHAPTQQLADQLGAAVRDAVQLLCFVRSVEVPVGEAMCPGGGWLEKELHRALGGTPLGRAELLQWHQHRSMQQHRDKEPLLVHLAAAFQGVSADLKKALAEAAAAVPRALAPKHHLDPPPEPVALRVAVLQHALATVLTLISVDVLLVAKRS